MASSHDQDDLWDSFKHLDGLQSPEAFNFSDVLSKPDCVRYFLSHHHVLQGAATGGSDPEPNMFVASSVHAPQPERRTEMTTYRRFFYQLYAYDFLQLVRASSPPEEQEKPVQPVDVNNFLGPASKDDSRIIDDQIVRSLSKDAAYGKILDFFCQKFGTGSLFFLREQLHGDFLSSNPPLVGSGVDAAFARLEHLGLGKRAQESRANELADKVREFFIAKFKSKKTSEGLNEEK